MATQPRRIVGIFALILGLWVVIFWMYPASSTPTITFGQRPEGGLTPAVVVESQGVAANSQPTQPPQQAGGPGAGSAGAAKPRSGSGAAQAQPSGPVTVIERPKFRAYTVRKGDVSFEAIAARTEVYGNRKLAWAIQDANSLVSPDKLIPGRTVLQIPLDPSNIQGRPVTIDPRTGRPNSANSPSGPTTGPSSGPTNAPTPPTPPTSLTPPAATPKQAPGEDYTVRDGDTLSGIAKAKYGKSALWTLILEANRDVLTDPAKVKPGMTLRIPPAPKGD